MTRKRLVPISIALAIVVVGSVTWAWDEWRMRRRLDEALSTLAPFVDGPVETWLQRLPPSPPPNASLREIERLARGTRILDLGGEGVRRAALRAAHGDAWADELRVYVEATITRTRAESEAETPPAFLLEQAAAIERIREHLLTQPLPEWPGSRDPDTRMQNLNSWIRLSDLLIADAQRRHDAGDHEGASRSLDAAWRLVEMFLRREEPISQLTAWRGAGRCAETVRQLETPNAEWRARLAIEPFRAAMIHAALVQCFEWQAAARADRLPSLAFDPFEEHPGWLPWQEPYRERAIVAAAIMSAAPLLRAMQDPARCGRTTIPASPAAAELDDSDLFVPPMFIGRLDRLRVQFELTRRVLELREQRAADPAGRWPLVRSEIRSECPCVRIVTTSPDPSRIVIEAVEDRHCLGRTLGPVILPLRIELVQPDPPPAQGL